MTHPTLLLLPLLTACAWTPASAQPDPCPSGPPKVSVTGCVVSIRDGTLSADTDPYDYLPDWCLEDVFPGASHIRYLDLLPGGAVFADNCVLGAFPARGFSWRGSECPTWGGEEE